MTTGRINQVFTSLLTPVSNNCSQKCNSRIQKNLSRMSHTSPDKAPDSAFTDCSQSTNQLLNSPAVLTS